MRKQNKLRVQSKFRYKLLGRSDNTNIRVKKWSYDCQLGFFQPLFRMMRSIIARQERSNSKVTERCLRRRDLEFDVSTTLQKHYYISDRSRGITIGSIQLSLFPSSFYLWSKFSIVYIYLLIRFIQLFARMNFEMQNMSRVETSNFSFITVREKNAIHHEFLNLDLHTQAFLHCQQLLILLKLALRIAKPLQTSCTFELWIKFQGKLMVRRNHP